MTTLFLVHLVFDFKLVLHVVNGPSPFFLLREKSIYQISKFNLETRRKFSIHLTKHSAEFFAVLKCVNFYPS